MTAILIIIAVLMMSGGDRENVNVFVILTFVVNICVFVVNYLSSINEHSYSFNMMFWLFNVFFFGLAPLMQYLYNSYAWNLVPSENEIIKTNVLILVWTICYIIGRNVVFNKKMFSKDKKNDNAKKSNVTTTYIDKKKLNILVLISIFASVYVVASIGLKNIFYRDTANITGESTTLALLITHVLKNTVLFSAILSVVDACERKRVTIAACITVGCLIISCFPTGLPRNMMASFYGGLLIIIFKKISNRRIFSFFILCGLVLIFPAMEIFRYGFTTSFNDFFELIGNSIKNTYLQGHYDAHQMFISIQRYTDMFGLSNGEQLLGALLFFIPRAIWPTKPLGSGHTVISGLNQFYFTNVSAPLASESYINFGIVGVIIGAIILGKLLKWIDNEYWESEGELKVIKIIYPSLMLMFFFLLRGDMMSAWAFTFAQLVMGVIICKFVIKTKR
jgi:oligosaccharide repeat unit polymerase